MRKYILLSLIFFTSLLTNAQKRYDVNIISENRIREAIISVPTKIPPEDGYPIVFMLHGTSGEASTYYLPKGWRELGQQNNFITVFPSALTWCFYEDGLTKHLSRFVCGNLLESICAEDTIKLVDDILFFKKLLNIIQDSVKVNKNKIFISGFSNGSCMIHNCAMKANDVFSAAAGSSGILSKLDSLKPAKRIPVWFMVGTKDDRFFSSKFPNELPWGGDSILTYLQGNINRTLTCQGLTNNYKKIVTDSSHVYIWTECRPGENCAPYVFSLNKNQTHEYPNGNNYFLDAPKLFWDFFNNPPPVTHSSYSEQEFYSSVSGVYPNPFNSTFTVYSGLDFDKKWSLNIRDISGNLIMKQKDIHGPEIELNLENNQSGVYIVEIINQFGSKFFKVIKPEQ